MPATLAQRLANVQTAIAAIETGQQSFSYEGRTYTRADLATLYAQEERLESRIERADNGGRRVAEF